jgi:hypothetical protein
MYYLLSLKRSIRLMLFLLNVILIVSVLCPTTTFGNDNKRPEEALLSVKENPGFKHFLTCLQYLVQSDGTHSQNHFFITKYLPDAEANYMIWREGRVFWVLSTLATTEEHWKTIIMHPRNARSLDLDNDVVPNREDVGTSTYLVDQPWVNEIVFDAVINGDMVIVEKKL